jgi:multicomponent Na+:H+ antiporter subunit B
MLGKYIDIIAELAARLMVPFIFIFGLYVLFFGHYSPGGGFQGGTILAAGVILLRIVLGRSATYKAFPPAAFMILGAAGLLIYAGTGLAAQLTGRNFLDYGGLPIPGLSEPERRYLGILFVETGVALGVCGVMVSIFDNLSRETSE